MLEVCDLEYSYPEISIRADFTVPAGGTVALMGASGSGKSTVLNMIAGLLDPERGDVRFQGRSLLGMAPADRPLSYLFQSNNLFPHLTVWQNLAVGLHPGLRVTDAQDAAIARALEWVSLEGFERRRPETLSGGQQQRVALARCLVRNRPLLLLDEPFSGLDENIRTEIQGLIRELQYNEQLTLLLTTHQRQDAESLDADIVNL